jgi:hypothetical protein
MKSYKMSEMKQLKVSEEPLQQQLEQLHALWFFAAHLQAADLTMSHSEGRGASSYLDWDPDLQMHHVIVNGVSQRKSEG